MKILLTPEEAAAALQLRPRTVVLLCRQGRIPAEKIGGRWRIPVAWLEEVAKKRLSGERATGSGGR